jgi:predicted glycoside hydrolase/deacetylase ChbG (UPF0249 family)
MKLIVRADDVGYTHVHNLGTFETIERGVSTSADVMLDTPGTEDALEKLRAFPWISVGWHAHFWGSPVLDPNQVPSLVIEENGRIRFRKDLQAAEDVKFEEILAECRAQMERCVRILGRAPDTGGMGMGGSPFRRAVKQVCDEYGIAYNFAKQRPLRDNEKPSPFAVTQSEKWAHRNIYMSNPGTAYEPLMTASLTEWEKYDPAKYYLEDAEHLLDFKENDYVMTAWHPGYVDNFVYRLGDYGPLAGNFILARLTDVEALCSDRLKNWIKKNRVELVNFRDALYGTREYQNHLRAIGSDLAVD